MAMTTVATRPISPIAVTYKGNTFKSLVEARWFIIGEELGWEVHYEPCKVEHETRYHPDLYSEKLNAFIEVKGSTPSNYDKQRMFAREKGVWVVVFIGQPSGHQALWINTNGVSSTRDVDFTKSPGWSAAVSKAMSFQPQWNPPTNAVPLVAWGAKPVKNPSLSGFHHPTFGAGYVVDRGIDDYGNDILYAHFVGKDGLLSSNGGVPVRADKVRFVERRFAGWTIGSDRSMSPREYLWTEKIFNIRLEQYNEDPWFFCRECERVCDVASESMRGDDLLVDINIEQDTPICRHGHCWDTSWRCVHKSISMYCCECTVKLDSGRITF